MIRICLAKPRKGNCRVYCAYGSKGARDRDVWRAELDRTSRDLDKLLQALKTGGAIETIVEDIKRLEVRKVDWSERLAAADEPAPLLHPNMSEIYRQRVTALHERLRDQSTKLEAMEVLRHLVDRDALKQCRYPSRCDSRANADATGEL